MINKILFLILIPTFISSCFSLDEEIDGNAKRSKTQLGDLKINYYSNKSVNTLDIPPDLTRPEEQKAFRLSEYVQDIDEKFINFSDKEIKKEPSEQILQNDAGIKVQRSGNRRWLEINKEPDKVWQLAKEFVKLEGFAIKKSNKKIGILETDYLENRPDLPDQSLGMIRSFIQSVTSQSYSLPVIDKYRFRIEPVDNYTKSHIFISLSSMKEIIDPNATISGNTTWIEKEPDIELETEMLLRFMQFLGGDKIKSIEKIVEAKETNLISANVAKGINGYSKMVFKNNFLDTWDAVSWILDKENVNLEDKDLKEKTFYVKMARTSDKGIMTYIFGDDAIEMIFQLQLKSIGEETTEVYFNDISELNEQETKNFSFEFFQNLLRHLKNN